MSNGSFNLGQINLMRRPRKILPNATGSVARHFIRNIGSFDLIPIEGGQFYNTEGRSFPDINDNNIDNKTIYLISDPDIGIIIPHIKKSKGFGVKGDIVVPDNICNMADLNQNQATPNVMFEICGYIFTQPIFCYDSGGVGGNPSWSMYIPRYKVEDSNIHFLEVPFDNFSTFFERRNDEEFNIKKVVISDKNIDETRFSQMGICKNGISMKNGLKYEIDNAGNVNFNIGNIKADSTAVMYMRKLKSEFNGASIFSDRNTLPIQFDSFSYSKGDVVSGNTFSSILSATLSNIFNILESKDDSISICESSSNLQIKETTFDDFDINTPFKIHFLHKNTYSEGNLKLKVNHGNTYTTGTISLIDNNSISADNPLRDGYYKAQFRRDGTGETSPMYFDLTTMTNVLYEEIKTLSSLISKYNILLVKK